MTMRYAKIFAMLAIATVATPALAAEAPGTIHRLSAGEIERAKDAGAARGQTATGIDGDVAPDRRVHGEMGFAIGTGGYTSVFGSAAIPLGDDGFAAFAFERSDFGRRYRR